MPRIRHDMLSGVRLFSGFDEATLALLGAKAQRRQLPMGTVAHETGDTEIPLLVVLQGCIRLEKCITENETARLRLVGEGDAVDELSFVSGMPTNCSAVAIEETTALQLTRDDFLSVSRRHPSIYATMVETLATRLRHCSEKVENLLSLDASARLAREILDYVPADGKNTSIEISVPFSQEEMAHRIGTRRETVNRCLKDMRSDGTLQDLGRNRYRVDVAGLYRTAGFAVVRNAAR